MSDSKVELYREFVQNVSPGNDATAEQQREFEYRKAVYLALLDIQEALVPKSKRD